MLFEFAMQGFTQAQDVGLCGRVNREVLHAQIGQQAGDEQDLPSPPSPHVLGKDVRDRSQAGDIKSHHRQSSVQIDIQKRALQSMSSVIYQDIDENSLAGELLMQVKDCVDGGKIDLRNNDCNVVLLTECGGESFKPVQAAGHKDQGMALRAILTGELLTETA